MLNRIRQLLNGNTERGFTRIELLFVIINNGAPPAIAALSLHDALPISANNATKANLRAALPSAEAYYGDNGTYVVMTPVTLKAIARCVPVRPTAASATATAYCLTDTVSGKTWSVKGPGPSSTHWYTTNN